MGKGKLGGGERVAWAVSFPVLSGELSTLGLAYCSQLREAVVFKSALRHELPHILF